MLARQQEAQVMGGVGGMESVELFVRHPAEPRMRVQGVAVRSELLDARFEPADLLEVIEATRWDEHAGRAHAADRIPGQKARQGEGPKERPKGEAQHAHPPGIAMHVGVHGAPQVLAHLS